MWDSPAAAPESATAKVCIPSFKLRVRPYDLLNALMYILMLLPLKK